MKILMALDLVIILLSACMVDSESMIPTLVCGLAVLLMWVLAEVKAHAKAD